MTTTPEAARLARELLACGTHDPARKHPDGSPAKGRWTVITAPTELVEALRAALVSQPDEARDAARYRWLRKVGGRVWHITSPDGSQLPDDVKAAAYDDCVDRERAAAMSKEQP